MTGKLRCGFYTLVEAIMREPFKGVGKPEHHGKHVVIISLEDYQSLEETAYLLRNKTGAQRLIESVEELRNVGGVERIDI